MKKIATFLFTVLGLFFLVNYYSSELVLAQPTISIPNMLLTFSEDWVTPGSSIKVTASITNTDPDQTLEGADLYLNFEGGAYFTNPVITTEYGYNCILTNSGGKYVHMTANCTGGVIPPNETAHIAFEDNAPSTVLYSYGTNIPVYAVLKPWEIQSSDGLLVVSSYAPDLLVIG